MNQILIINQQKTSDSHTLTASINIPVQMSNEALEGLVSEFKSKLIYYTSLPAKKTFSSITRASEQSETMAHVIKSSPEHYQREVATMKMDQVIDALKSLKVIEDRVIDFVTHEQALAVRNNTQTISLDGDRATLQFKDSRIINLDVSDLVYNIHSILKDNTTLEDFSRKIYYTWESISF